MLHALQAGREPGRVSQDLDTVIDARVRPPALPAFLATLANLGFKSAGVSPDDVVHRSSVAPYTSTSSGRTDSAAAPTCAQPAQQQPSKSEAAHRHCSEPNGSPFATAIVLFMCRGQTCSGPS